MVEVALALVILAIGLSSVMVLFPVGLKASRSSVADNNLADVAERMAAYLQAKCTAPDVWNKEGGFSGGSSIPNFVSEPTGVPYDTSEFTHKAGGMDGLFTNGSDKQYYLYRQYSSNSGSSTNDSDRPVDFEAMIRIGWDTQSRSEIYYPVVGGGNSQGQSPLSGYSRSLTDPPTGHKMIAAESESGIIGNFFRTLVIEISWPANAPWKNREKRIFRVEMFNENFVPYPQQSGSNP